MAHKESAPHGGHGGQGGHGAPGAPAAPPAHGAPGAHTAGHEAHAHPTWKQYKWVALILTVITAVEVWVYYIPSFVKSKLFVPSLLIMSAVKFAIVVMYYMHLKYDARLFRALFTGPLIIAVVTIISLMFLFGHIAVRLGS
jgi:cytochrome c oxidase subunit IV